MTSPAQSQMWMNGRCRSVQQRMSVSPAMISKSSHFA